MRKICLLTMIIVSVFFNASHAFAQKKTIRISTIYNYPPYCYLKENAISSLKNEIVNNGEDSKILTGLSWEIVREAYHATGYSIELYVTPWSRALSYVDKQRVDVIFPTTINLKRQKKYYFSKELSNPKSKILIYVRNDSDIKWHGLSSLKGQIIATVGGWSYGIKWDEYEKNDSGVKIIRVNNIDVAFKNLITGRINGLVGYDIVFDYQAKKLGIFNKVRKLSHFDIASENVMGLQSNSTQKFLDDYDKGYQIIKANGLLEQIRKKYN